MYQNIIIPAPTLQELGVPRISESELQQGLTGQGLVLRRGKTSVGSLELRNLVVAEVDAETAAGRKQPMGLINGEVPAGMVLVAVGAAGICGSDVKNAFSDNQSYSQYEGGRLLLHEASGVIISVGEGVTNVSAGDVVALNPAVATKASRATLLGLPQLDEDLGFCSIDWHGFSRRFVLHPADHACKVSREIGMEVAALVEPMACAVRACEKAGLRDLHNTTDTFLKGYVPSVLVIGGGLLGSMVAVCATSKDMNARVTVVTRSRDSQDWFESLKIPSANSCLVADASAAFLKNLNGQSADTDGLFDAMIVCTHQPGEFTHYLEALNHHGPKVVIAGGSQDEIGAHARQLMLSEASISFARRYTPRDFDHAARIVEQESQTVRRLIAHVSEPEDAPKLMQNVWQGGKGKAQIRYL